MDTAVSEALELIRRSRDYLYAVLPEGKQDERLQGYGFEAIEVNGRRRKKDEQPQPA